MLAIERNEELAEEKSALRVDSKVTARGQTTLPKPVCEALHIKPGEDRISYQILSGGRVLLRRHEEEQSDPVVGAFLAFLENDMVRNPSHIKPLDADLFARGAALVDGIDVDLDEDLVFDDD
ncbi:type II toxin-antitoxin system PrlF family antitoxin [Erwiniaceae bacterium L1_54_6]|jgi:antitoxin PrlF|nr:type II toxin-antitoxin system PrlF family antitoxin [Erwiniaceae bacterium L1_54_6]